MGGGRWFNKNTRSKQSRDNVPLRCNDLKTVQFHALLCTVLQCTECQYFGVSVYSIMLFPYSGFDEKDDWQVVKSKRRHLDMSLCNGVHFHNFAQKRGSWFLIKGVSWHGYTATVLTNSNVNDIETKRKEASILAFFLISKRIELNYHGNKENRMSSFLKYRWFDISINCFRSTRIIPGLKTKSTRQFVMADKKSNLSVSK